MWWPRDRKFLLFSVALACELLALLTLFGYGQRFLSADWLWFQQHVLFLLMALAQIAFALFSVALLNLREHNIRWVQWIRGAAGIGALMTVASLFMPIEMSGNLVLLYSLALSVLLAGIGNMGH